MAQLQVELGSVGTGAGNGNEAGEKDAGKFHAISPG
jgi:hypothetical protein